MTPDAASVTPDAASVTPEVANVAPEVANVAPEVANAPAGLVPARRPFARLERIAGGRAGLLLVGAWAFAEAIAFPIIPDAAIGLLALVVPRRALRLWAALIVGALAGTVVLYALTVAAPGAVEAMLLALPGIPPSMLEHAGTVVAGGSPASIAIAGPGTPLKVYTWAWATGPATPLALLAGAFLNRITRVAPGLIALTALGVLAPGFLRRHDRLTLVVYVGCYAIAYPVYWALVGS